MILHPLGFCLFRCIQTGILFLDHPRLSRLCRLSVVVVSAARGGVINSSRHTGKASLSGFFMCGGISHFGQRLWCFGAEPGSESCPPHRKALLMSQTHTHTHTSVISAGDRTSQDGTRPHHRQAGVAIVPGNFENKKKKPQHAYCLSFVLVLVRNQIR